MSGYLSITQCHLAVDRVTSHRCPSFALLSSRSKQHEQTRQAEENQTSETNQVEAIVIISGVNEHFCVIKGFGELALLRSGQLMRGSGAVGCTVF